MRLTLLSIFSLFLFNAAFSQIAGKVDVKVIDQQQKPQDGVFVQLVKAKDSVMAQYTITETTGTAEFTNVAKGQYMIYISQTGFENYFSKAFEVDSNHSQIALPDVVLQSKTLNAVTVVGKTPPIQHFADKTVVNVSESVLAAQGTAFDVIERSPGIRVDQNDNISMQGKQNVMVMIDGRITPMSGSDLANLLRGMPAEAIEKIEFITNPSAKYDANGTAGIINIILKKDKRIGMNGTVNVGYSQGIYAKTNDGFSFNNRTKKFNLFGSYNYSYRGFSDQIILKSNFYNGSELTGGTQQYEFLTTPSTTNMARLGADFFASDKTTIGIILDGSTTQFNPTTNTTSYLYDSANNAQSYNITKSISPSTTNNYAVNLNMKHKFDSAGRELLINVDYADYSTNAYQNITTNYYSLNNTEMSSPSYFYGSLPGMLNIYSFKADYDGQLGKKGTLEAGVKSSYVKTDNTVSIYDGPTDASPLDTTQSNHFIYSENINAGYISYGRDMGKASLQAGLRAEQTITNGDQVTTGQTFSRNFTQLFPNISINDSVSKNSQLGLSITRRIDRPTYEQLNPFRIYVNPTFYLQGNPYLLPQNAYSFQLSETYKQNYSITFTYTHTANAITTVIEPLAGMPDMVQQTNENLSSLDYYGVNLYAVFPITKWWNTTLSGDGYYNHYAADLANTPLSTMRFLWDISSVNSFTFNKKFSGDAIFFYNSGFDLGYLYLQSQWSLSAGIQMKIMNGKGSLKLNVSDIFWTELTNAVTTFSDFNQTIFVRRDTRAVGLAFTYHFGGNSQSSLRSKGGAEDEKKRASNDKG